MKRLLVAALLGAGVWLVLAPFEAQSRPAAKAKRLSVLDYYFLLPYVGNELVGTPRETVKQQRQQMLKQSPEFGPVIDLRRDYMSVKPDSSPRAQIAVFRGGGADVVAYSAPDYQSDYNAFALFQLQNGKLRDVTKGLLPIPARTNKFLYELPPVGTTIHVFSFDLVNQTRKPAFDLLWREGRFIKVNLNRTKP